ncbi:MAG TPA: TIGR03435 family protein [Bryobacteraceae bacterium]|jgi:uncharacterized protein (TIGR03435 family)
MLLRIVVYAVLFLAVSFAQSSPAQSEGPRFEVVAIKPIRRPTPGDGSPYGLTVSGARVQGVYQLFSFFTRAFRVESPQVDAPDFAREEFFEIQATLPAGATTEQVPQMLQAMLAERFKLAYHRETREYQMDVLTVGKEGMKLPRLPDGTQAPTRYNSLPDGTMRVTMTGKVSSWFPTMNSFGGLQLVDETGLDGIYTWVQDRPPATPGMSREDTEQEGFKAMIEAAGLKLEKRKVPKETIVVDHLEKMPTEN